MKTAFVTGSSRGIGRAIAKRLAADGYKVILHGVSESNHIKELKNIIEREGGVAEIATADLCNVEATKGLFEAVSAGVASGVILVFFKQNGLVSFITLAVAFFCMAAFVMTFFLPESVALIGKEKENK